MKFDTNRGHGSAYAVQEQALIHFRRVLNRLDVAFSEVSRLSDGDGVRVISPVDGRDAAPRRIQRVASVYDVVCGREWWTPPRCEIELPFRSAGRVATAHVKREWLPDGNPEEYSDADTEAVTSHIQETAEIRPAESTEVDSRV